MLTQRNDKLTKEEELELGRKIQEMKRLQAVKNTGHDELTEKDRKAITEGDIALEQLVSNYYNLARDIAHKHYKRTGTKYAIDDLIQDAITALVDAAYNYDPDKNCRLSTYAFYGITKKVSTAINYQRLVRMPENKMGEYITISKAQRDYEALSEEEKEEFDSELAYVYENVGDLKKEEVDLILTNMQPQVSLNAEIYDGNGELMDLLVDEKAEQEVIQLEDVNLNEEIVDVIEKLNSYERDLIAFEFGAFSASMTYTEFQNKYKLSDQKIKLETNKAIRKMRAIAEQAN